jgi:hypothetical protein
MVSRLGHGAFLGSYVCARLHDLANSVASSDDAAAADAVACLHSHFCLRAEELRQASAFQRCRNLSSPCRIERRGRRGD